MHQRSHVRPISILFVAFVATVFFLAGASTGGQRPALAQTSPPPSGSPSPDGDPVGFDLYGSGTTAVSASGSGMCLTSTGGPSCKSVEVHYLTNPTPTCPSDPLPDNVACSAGTLRALPSCPPSGARCLLFSNVQVTAYSQDDDGVVHTEPTTSAQVMLILK